MEMTISWRGPQGKTERTVVGVVPLAGHVYPGAPARVRLHVTQEGMTASATVHLMRHEAEALAQAISGAAKEN
jgi:hypothetical protein